jgi:hypothetical protein
LEEALTELLGKRNNDSADEEDGNFFLNDEPNYITSETAPGIIIVCGPEPQYYGDEVLAFWIPNGIDISFLKDQLTTWEMGQLP